MTIIVWTLVFVVSLALMVKSADWLLEKSEKIGLALGISPFVVGVTIVGMGTSFPELISGLMAVWGGAPEIVVANAFGSNVANILLVVGLAAVMARKLVIIVSKNLIDLDLPLLAISTALIVGIVADKQVTFVEGLILIAAYIVYLISSMQDKEKEDADIKTEKDLPDIIKGEEFESKKQFKKEKSKSVKSRPKINGMDVAVLILGIIGLFFGSKYLIESVIVISDVLAISTGVIAISAVAVGTSLPELLVSIKAARQGKAEIAIGNVFGSNVFNLLLVIGIPALLKTIPLDEKTFTIGLPAMVISTLVFIISGISRRIHIWEGLMYLIMYILFIGMLFGLI